MDEITITRGTTVVTVWYSEMNNGYMYDINNDKDGGICTGTEEDAVLMAMKQAGII